MFRAILPVPLLLLCAGFALGAGLAIGQAFTSDPAPQQPQRKQVKVSTKTLDRYVGRFTMQGLIVKVTRDNDHLFIQKNDGPRTEVFAEADFQFFAKSSDEVFSFEGVTGGKAIILKIAAEGHTTPLYRVD